MHVQMRSKFDPMIQSIEPETGEQDFCPEQVAEQLDHKKKIESLTGQYDFDYPVDLDVNLVTPKPQLQKHLQTLINQI